LKPKKKRRREKVRKLEELEPVSDKMNQLLLSLASHLRQLLATVRHEQTTDKNQKRIL
jgi:hypothetical protein